MSITERLGRIEAQITHRRETSEACARRLAARLDGVWDTKIVQTDPDVTAVRVTYPHTRTAWVTVSCVMYDDRPRWEWSWFLRPIAEGDDLETVIDHLTRLFAGELFPHEA